MADRSGDRPEKRRRRNWMEQITEKERRRVEARRAGDRGVWFGLGMFGLVGWSFAVPALLCLALGIWLDRITGGRVSWSLTLLVLGVGLGSLNAWYWVSRERRKIERRDEKDGD